MSDTLHFGWQDSKFVLLVETNAKRIRHRISLTEAEADYVALKITERHKTLASQPNHVQVDTRDEDTEGTVEVKSLNECHYKSNDEREAITYIKSRYGDGWLVNKFRGERAFSNGHLALCGVPPAGEPTAANAPGFDAVIDSNRDSTDTPLIPVALTTLDA